MNLYRCFYHIVWATKDHAPLITPEREKILYPLLNKKYQKIGSTLLAVNGIADHIHLVLEIPPSQSIPQVIEYLKGFSSRELNRQITDEGEFSWQTGYSIFTVSELTLPDTLTYIANQKQNHSTGSINAYYERFGDDE